jgi:hypothetical protein
VSRGIFEEPPKKKEERNMKIENVTGRRKRRTRASLQRHARKCHICHHPERDEIEDDFLNWHGPDKIVSDYKLPHYSTIYRHANAFGLRARRNENFRTALDYLVEQADSATVTGNTIIRAMRAYSCLKDDGTWVELPRKVVHETRGKSRSASARRTKSQASSAARASRILIANPRLKSTATR